MEIQIADRIVEVIGRQFSEVLAEIIENYLSEELHTKWKCQVRIIGPLSTEGGALANFCITDCETECVSGDEVLYQDIRAIVCSDHMGNYDLLTLTGNVFESIPGTALRKTGRQYNILRYLLEAINEDPPTEIH